MSASITRPCLLTKGVVDADSPSHALLTLNGREYFGRVLERDRAFAQRVGNCEEIDESSQVSEIPYVEKVRAYKTTGPICAPRLPLWLRRDKPAASKKIHITGKV